MHIILSLYIMTLFLFTTVSNAISYCILLIVSSLLVSSLFFFFQNAIWYALILYLIYIGGVYILFLFLSIHIPNSINFNSINLLLLLYCFFFSLEFGNLSINFINIVDFSFYFCNYSEGLSYVFICCFLLVGFILVSFVSSSKIYFCR
uniref:NADH dehydrogenase subunit 6 n=1 Tax=Neobenedenia melleni TaxID=280695 RepID=A0A096VGU6_9PLAT|nr:NADH dehydrogenase subunit 6 [Neobenedenia melleni]